MDTSPQEPTPAIGPVVVGVDGSSYSTAAIRWAAMTAWQRGATLRVVHAWVVPAVASTTPLMSGVFVDPAPFEEQGEHILAGAAARVRSERGLRAPHIETVLAQGPAAAALREQCEGASLLVVGSHGRSALADAVLGSVADESLRHAETPVAVIHGDGRVDHGDIVVGVDDSPAGRAALTWATLEADRTDRRLVVVHADDGRGGIAPAETLLDAANGAALLVVGRSAHRGLVKRLLGSVSQRCVHHAECPVIVVPEPLTVTDDQLTCVS